MEPDPLARRNAPDEILADLRGRRVAFATSSYGEELVLGFGERRDKRVGEISIPWAEWMLFTRNTPWVFETDDGVIATDRNRLNEGVLSTLSEAIGSAEVLETRIRTKALALGVELSNRTRLSLLPRRGEANGYEVWTLSTPDGAMLRALSSGRLDLVEDDDGIPWPEGDERFLDVAVEELEPIEAVRAAARSAAGTEPDIAVLFEALNQLVRVSGFGVFGPVLGRTSLADFVLVDPAGKLVLVQIKTSRRALEPEARIPRVVVTLDSLSEEEREVLDSEPRSAVLPLAQVSTETVAELVSRLAG